MNLLKLIKLRDYTNDNINSVIYKILIFLN